MCVCVCACVCVPVCVCVVCMDIYIYICACMCNHVDVAAGMIGNGNTMVGYSIAALTIFTRASYSKVPCVLFTFSLSLSLSVL